MADSFVIKSYQTVASIRGPLLIVEGVPGVAFEEIVEIRGPNGEERRGRVLEAHEDRAVVQVFEGTEGLNVEGTSVRFQGEVARFGVSRSVLGRVLDGSGRPIDGGPPLASEVRANINGSPVNPFARAHPNEFVQTGLSVIDGLNSLARGQKLPVFTGTGLPANELAAQIADQAKVLGEEAEGSFAVVFAAIGINQRESAFFEEYFRGSGQFERTAVFLNRAEDPTIERILTPRVALTVAEYLAFTAGYHVVVIMTDMVNYAEALREVSAAREEVPGRRGYPAYMYSDLASLYERVGRLREGEGSLTQIVMLTMPDDDITHPIPDLTGYITEGQIVLSRELQQRGVYPPVDALPSLSRLMKAAIGEGRTREDHQDVANQLYALYAEANDLRRLASIIGEGALSDEDQRVLAFAESFEHRFVGQGKTERTIERTLEIAWELLREMPRGRLKRVTEEQLDRYYEDGSQ